MEISDSSSRIQEALQVAELLQLNELQNFFGDECVQIVCQNKSISKLIGNKSTAVLNTIFLNEHIYMLMRLPNGSVNSYLVGSSVPELTKEINQLRLKLSDISTDEYLKGSQLIYNLLIGPIVADLTSNKIGTLVFINDSVLRSLPMGALHGWR